MKKHRKCPALYPLQPLLILRLINSGQMLLSTCFEIFPSVYTLIIDTNHTMTFHYGQAFQADLETPARAIPAVP